MAAKRQITKPTGAQPVRTGGYRRTRDADGMTPKERLETRKAELAELELAEKRRQLMKVSDHDAQEAEAAEIIRNDLGYQLPSALASALSGRVFTAQEVKRVSLDLIRAIIRRWNDGGQINKEAVP